MGNLSMCTTASATDDIANLSSPVFLYDCLLIEILSYLDIKTLISVAQACKRLRDLAYRRQFWRGVIINMSTNKSISKATWKSLEKRGIRMIRISERNIFEYTNDRKVRSRNKSHMRRIMKHYTTNFRASFRAESKRSLFLVVETSTVLLSTRQYSVIKPLSLSNFTYLTSLYMVLCLTVFEFVRHHKRLAQSLRSLTNLEQLTFLVNVEDHHLPVHNDLSWHDYEAFDNLDYVNVILSCLPCLTDFTIGKSYHDFFGRREVEVICEDLLDSLSVPMLERLCIQYGLLSQKIQGFSSKLTNLMNLEIGQPLGRSYGASFNIEPALDLIMKLKYLRSLKVNLESGVDYPVLVPDSLHALHITCVVTENLIDFQKIVGASRNLCVIELDMKTVTDDQVTSSCLGVSISSLCSVISALSHLHILTLSLETCLEIDDELLEVITCKKSLQSVLGVKFIDTGNLPSNIQYISKDISQQQENNNSYKILKRVSNQTWIQIENFSTDWYHACGRYYFHACKDLGYGLAPIQKFLFDERHQHEKRCRDIDEERQRRLNV